MSAASQPFRWKVKCMPWMKGGPFLLPSDVQKRILFAQERYPGAGMGTLGIALSGYVCWIEGKGDSTLALGIAAVYTPGEEHEDYWDPMRDPMEWSTHGPPRNGLPSFHGNGFRELWIDYLWSSDPGKGYGSAVLNKLEELLSSFARGSVQRKNIYVAAAAPSPSFYYNRGYRMLFPKADDSDMESWSYARCRGVFLMARPARLPPPFGQPLMLDQEHPEKPDHMLTFKWRLRAYYPTYLEDGDREEVIAVVEKDEWDASDRKFLLSKAKFRGAEVYFST